MIKNLSKRLLPEACTRESINSVRRWCGNWLALCYNRHAFKWVPHSRRDLRIGFDFRLKFRVQVPTQKHILARPKIYFGSTQIGFFGSGIGPRTESRKWGRGPKTWSRNRLRKSIKSLAQKARPLWRAYTKLTRTNFLVQLLDQLLSPGFGISLESIYGLKSWSNS